MRIVKLILLCFFIYQTSAAQIAARSDSMNNSAGDTLISDSNHVIFKPGVSTYYSLLDSLLSANKFIKHKQKPVYFIIDKKTTPGKENLFYLVSMIILVFGIFKVLYSKYFDKIFRIFFNTSLRHNQLTDLLLQATLPSLILNTFFLITGGLFAWLLLSHYYFNDTNNYKLLLFCIAAVTIIYTGKFCVLKFIGWVTETKSISNTYIFVIFLINKIIGITLIPFIVCIAFAPPAFINGTVILSSLILVIFFIMRFIRSYSLLQNQLLFSRLHFLLYIVTLEILPLLIIYKFSLIFIHKIV
jgi:hypothetical protein